MNQQPGQFESTLDQWLDGQLSPQAAVAFETELQAHPSLKSRVDAAKAIDESLLRVFGPEASAVDSPPASRTQPHLNGTVAQRPKIDAGAVETADWVGSPPRRSPLWRRLAVAAAIAGVLLGGWQGWRLLNQPGPAYRVPEWQSLARVYQQTVADGFRPTWVCDTDAEFMRVFEDQYGQPLSLGGLPSDIEALGLSYCHSISPQTTCILIEVAGKHVMVFIDRLERDGQQDDPSPLFRHRQELGKLVVYEVSLLDHPVVLEHLTSPAGGSE